MKFDLYYTLFYLVAMVAIHFYKSYGGLKYPPNVWGMELACLLIWGFVQLTRLYFGILANRTEAKGETGFFIVLTIATTYMVAHFSSLVTYVLLIEILLGIALFILGALQLIFSLYGFCTFETDAKLEMD